MAKRSRAARHGRSAPGCRFIALTLALQWSPVLGGRCAHCLSGVIAAAGLRLIQLLGDHTPAGAQSAVASFLALSFRPYGLAGLWGLAVGPGWVAREHQLSVRSGTAIELQWRRSASSCPPVTANGSYIHKRGCVRLRPRAPGTDDRLGGLARRPILRPRRPCPAGAATQLGERQQAQRLEAALNWVCGSAGSRSRRPAKSMAVWGVHGGGQKWQRRAGSAPGSAVLLPGRSAIEARRPLIVSRCNRRSSGHEHPREPKWKVRRR